ncbi:MAG: ubiquitin-like domain-containing protein [Symbiobacteriia bacterium]
MQVKVDGQAFSLRTHARTVGAVLAQAGVELAPEDAVVPSLAAAVASGQAIQVQRAVPVQLTVGGQAQTVRTAAATVGEALAAAGVKVDDMVKVEPAVATAIQAGMQILVKQLTVVTKVVEQPIPYDTVRRADSSLELGRESVVQKGENGTQQVTLRDTLEDGQRVKSEVLDTKVLKVPTAQVVAYGTVGQVSRGGQTLRFTKALVLTATGYTAGTESNPWATGYTYTGLKATRGVVAVDPRVIPLGSRLYIDGYGYAVAADIGGAIKGNRIDLCFDTVKEADDYGLQRGIKVYILQ